MERRLAAILAADVVGYSAMMGADEARALEWIRRLREELFEPTVERLRGNVVKRLGDGWLVEFTSAVDAVECALTVQEALAKEDLSLRVGVHIGDIVHVGGDIYGDGVNVAARLEAISQAGFVVISGDTLRQVSGKVSESFQDNGNVELKNINEPVRVWSWPETLAEAQSVSELVDVKPALHVAQFDASSGDAEEMANAVADELRTAFAQQTGVALVGDPTQAEYLIGGSVRGSGVRWRISCHLIEIVSGKSVWSQRFDENDDDVFGILDRCVMRIAGAVRIRLPSLLASKSEARPFDAMNVEELLNIAMNNHFKPTLESWEQSRLALQTALVRDPNNWMAMTMLCFNRVATGRLFGWSGIDANDSAIAREMIERANEVKPNNDVVRTVRGGLYLYLDGNNRAARIEVEEALKLNPNFYHSINLMSQVEMFDGQLDRARKWARHAVECDPAYPYLHVYQHDAGQVELVAGEYEAALDFFERANHAAPHLPPNLMCICVAKQLSDDFEGAREAMKELTSLVPGFNLEELWPWPFRDIAPWHSVKEALSQAGAPRKRH